MNVPHAPPVEALQSLRWGTYPTPLRRFSGHDEASHDIWIKDDGQTAAVYGGNKVRKLERLLAMAQRQGAKRLLTVGAAGSHHVLATCLFGRRLGLPTHAVLTPQPWSAHAEATLRAGVHAGLSTAPVSSYLAAIYRLRRDRRPGDFLIGPGGCGVEGTWAYCLAVEELWQQLQAQPLKAPDAIVVAAGSGSTAAGLLAGVLRSGAPTRVIAVQVAPNPALRSMIVSQALAALRRHGHSIGPVRALRSLSVDRRFVGRGYGHRSAVGDHASQLARSFGLSLEPTYTAKAFAATLRWAGHVAQPLEECKLRLHQRQTYLYWHTLSSAPLAILLEGAHEKLPNELTQLLRKPYLQLGTD